MAQPKAPRFSDAAVEVLLEQVKSRREVFFPTDGRPLLRHTLRQAWKELAVSVNARSNSPRTGEQCRQKFNDLTRTARDKLAHRQRERSCVLPLSRVEQEALDLWRAGRRRLEKQPTGAQPPQGASQDWGRAGRETEEEQLPGGTAASTVQHSEPGAGRESVGQSMGSTRSESLGEGEQEPPAVGWAERVGDGWSGGLAFGAGEDGEDRELGSPAFRRRVFHLHHQLLEALDSLSGSCQALSRGTESAPTLAHLLLRTLSSLQDLTQRVPSCVSTAGTTSAPEPEAPALAPLIQAQKAALQGLVCSVSTGLDQLQERLDRGFNRVTGYRSPSSHGAAAWESRA
ncbi:uncharacterized protein LOC144611828 [Rhinoraja longicauda]